MTIPNIAAWAARKGIGLVATGDDAPNLVSGDREGFGGDGEWVAKT